MGSIDHWDFESRRRAARYLMTNARDLNTRYAGLVRECIALVRRHATAWARECREAIVKPADEGNTLWQLRMRQAEADMAKTLAGKPVQPTQQIGLL